ncbi:hypothetical protein SAMN04488570_2211 [Nocardioides scoriae]|uniref:Mce-associated membrane protein n=1 Tax=Nocardioides scoriae TaxID=642780 RepID=A0A1H1TEF5_9ACTN|nr:hypothetical protein [Nocardioides scoriae]SDS58558.1 hypothetical protein SAMN04488570_2211 [Nocardioides scoriae]
MPTARPSRLRAALTSLLAVLLVVGVVGAGYLVYRMEHLTDRPFDPVSSGSRVPDAAQRSEVTAVAEQFALRMDTVDGSDFDSYVKGINQMLTTKARARNTETFTALQKTYEAAKVKGKGKVLLSGVSDIDSDSATVLVAHDASVTTTQGDIEHHYRWSVSLVEVDGRWLVDDFTPVN